MNYNGNKEIVDLNFQLLTTQQELKEARGEVEVLKAKFGRAVEQRNDLYERIENFDDTERNKLIKMCDDELAAITIDSIKRGENV